MNKSTLLKLVTGHDLTCGWDMVCCYQQDKLNEMLAKEYTSGKMVKEISFKEEVPAVFVPGSVVYDVKFSLKAPTIQFTQSGYCNVEMLIQSGHITLSYMGNVTNEIRLSEDQYKILGNIQLSAVSGGMESVDKVLKSQDGSSDHVSTNAPNEVITFNGSNHGDKMYVYLNFSTASENGGFTFSPVKEKANEDTAAMESLLLIIENAVNRYFRTEVDSFQYILGGISSVPDEYKDSINLYPRSCLFNTQKGLDNACLNIYLQVSDSQDGESGTYKGHIGSLKTQFPDTQLTVFPLPENTSATIALSKFLLLELYIRGACKNIGWSADIDFTQTGGLTFLLSNAAVTITSEEISKRFSAGSIHTSSKHDGFIIDFKNVPIQLIFKDMSGKFSWNHTVNIEYNQSVTTQAGYVTNIEEYFGNVDYTISCDKDIQLSQIGQDQVKIACSLKKSEYKLKGTVKKAQKKNIFISEDPETGKTLIANISESVKPKLPEFSFDFGELNLFFAANLLFPGKHTFVIAKEDPFAFPSDMMIFGSIGLPAANSDESGSL